MTNEELVLLIKAGHNSYQEQLWRQVNRFVAGQAGRYCLLHSKRCRSIHLELDDFIQVGYFAMLNAIDAYTEESGYKFLTFLGKHLLNEFQKLTGLRDLSSKSQESRKRQCSIDEPISFETLLDSDDDGLSLANTIPDPQATKALEKVDEDDYLEKLRADLDNALGQLPMKQAEGIRRYYLDNETFTYISKVLGISYSYLQELVRTGLLSLRKCSELEKYRTDQYSRAYRGGVRAFRRSGSSSTEQIVMNIDAQERKLKAYLLGLSAQEI